MLTRAQLDVTPGVDAAVSDQPEPEVTELPLPHAVAGHALDGDHKPQPAEQTPVCGVCGFSVVDDDAGQRHTPGPEELPAVAAWLQAYFDRGSS